MTSTMPKRARFTQGFAIVGGAGLVAFATWAVTTGPRNLGLLAVGAFALIVIFAAKPAWRRPSCYAAALLLVIFSATTAVTAGELGAILSVATRVLGFVILIGLSALRSPVRPAPKRLSDHGRWHVSLTAFLAVYLLVAAGLHGQFVLLILYGIGLVLLVVTAHFLQRDDDPALAKGILIALVMLMISSVLLGLVVPSLGTEMGRLRGVLENANSLGFFAFILGISALTLAKSMYTRVVSLSLTALVLVWTASRASTLALAIVVLLLLFRRGLLRVVFFFAMAAAVAAVVWALQPALFEPLQGLLRLNDSRSGSTEVAVNAFVSSPLIGIGLGNEEAIIASSPFRALAQAGIFGLAAVVGMWASVLVAGVRSAFALGSFALAAVVHSVFEGWLLSPVSPFLGIFVITWIAIDRGDVARSTPYRRNFADLADLAGRKDSRLGARR